MFNKSCYCKKGVNLQTLIWISWMYFSVATSREQQGKWGEAMRGVPNVTSSHREDDITMTSFFSRRRKWRHRYIVFSERRRSHIEPSWLGRGRFSIAASEKSIIILWANSISPAKQPNTDASLQEWVTCFISELLPAKLGWIGHFALQVHAFFSPSLLPWEAEELSL